MEERVGLDALQTLVGGGGVTAVNPLREDIETLTPVNKLVDYL